MTKQTGTKEIVVNGQTVTVRVFAAEGQLRQRIASARSSRDPLAFEREAEARAEAGYLGVDLGHGYSSF